jgi:hypothetical protein
LRLSGMNRLWPNELTVDESHVAVQYLTKKEIMR